ncbi:phage shock protein C, PspC [Methanofollis liminatans DSM 4140]|uniref:Phage shock protein C, PspC n=1 Tax=Methanofollis liminatans DSM 4140 TaxID=28892 RepID=J0S6Q2_9EURY|nr:PspC domain-containing protein [Methanofollis liminatans]EJG06214.1 phage shock protein C, PspC [Methanofollis liminatans DSM 4140]
MAEKRLVRPRDDRVVAGVCSGIARYLDIDPVVVRLIWVILSMIGFVFTGIVVYLAAWLIIPEEEEDIIDAEYTVSEEAKV